MNRKNYPKKGNINIGNDFWIGYNANIMAGVIIRDEAINVINSTVINI